MTRPIDVGERVAQWAQAYEAVEQTFGHEGLAPLIVLAQPSAGFESINQGLAAARTVYANRRAAAIVAAMLVATGIKPIDVGGFGEEP